jgi:hypothetical protein
MLRGDRSSIRTPALGLNWHQMFSGSFPFQDIKNEFRFMLEVKQGKRPLRPPHDPSSSRGLTDEVWKLMEECWASHPEDRPSAAKVVRCIRSLCHLQADQRPPDDFHFSPRNFRSKLRVDDPFAPLFLPAGSS